jgi:hypothetical protein
MGARWAAHGGLRRLATLTGRAKIPKSTRIGFRARPKPQWVQVACWKTGPITILMFNQYKPGIFLYL